MNCRQARRRVIRHMTGPGAPGMVAAKENNMRARFRRSLDKREEGFTLIELLVVMIIIGILAAIAIPVFLSQRAKGQDTATKADVSTVGKELATYFIDGVGAPPVVTIVAGRWPV